MPSFKLRNFHVVKTINGLTPDTSGNIAITVSRGEDGTPVFTFKEEVFILPSSRLLTLAFYPDITVPLTVTVNGLVQSTSDYSVDGRVIAFPVGGAQTNDIVRVMYAHGG